MLEISRPTDAVTLAADITTNTTTQTVRGRAGYKTFWAEVIGTGAVTADIAIYGCRTIENANGVLVATINLTGTTRDQGAATTSTAVYPYYYVTTTNVTGTGATVRVEVFY